MQYFDRNDEGYFQWLRENKNGFALGMGRRPHEGTPPYFATVHRASCGKNATTNTQSFPKWCSNDLGELIVIAQQQEGPRYPLACKICRPF